MNSSSILNRTEEFFDRLGRALGPPSPRNRDVVAEVRADFLAQVEDLLGEGVPEAEAVDRVLEQMGAPESLAADMKVVLPPLSSGPVAVIRYVLAAGVFGWTLLLMWIFRAWDYGLSPGMFFALLFHLPVILVLWPRIIWRKNWLFGVVPAAVLVLGALALNVAGTSSTGMEIAMTEDGVLVPTPEIEVAESDEGVRWQLVALMSALGVAVLILFGMMQRSRQRWVALVAVVVPVLVVEGAFQWEEGVFRQQRDRLVRLVAEKGESMPLRGTLEELGMDHLRQGGRSYALSEDRVHVTLLWSRTLSSGFAIGYDSEDGRIWVND